MVDALKNRYLYQRALVDEVVWQMIYHASDKPIQEGASTSRTWTATLKSGLIDNGIDLQYHFKVIDHDGAGSLSLSRL